MDGVSSGRRRGNRCVLKAAMKATTAGVDGGTENEYETDEGERGQCEDDDQIESCRRGDGRSEERSWRDGRHGGKRLLEVVVVVGEDMTVGKKQRTSSGWVSSFLKGLKG
jgi:hypothetical protein